MLSLFPTVLPECFRGMTGMFASNRLQEGGSRSALQAKQREWIHMEDPAQDANQIYKKNTLIDHVE